MSAPETPAVGGPPRVVLLGDVMTDIVVRLASEIVPFSDTRATISLSPGGSATNQAVWLARAGAEVHLIAVVGDDEFGSSSLRELDDEAVVAHVPRLKDRSSGLVISIVGPQGRRSMLTARGANFELASAHPPASLFRGGGHFHVSGYELFDDETRPAALDLIERARDSGMTLSVDPNSAGPLEKVGAEAFYSWTEGFEMCCTNSDEGRVLTGADSPVEIAEALIAHYPLVACTLGSNGALVATRDGPTIVRPPMPATVVDTTGAGDAFCGAFLDAWLRGFSPEQSLDAGLEAAAVAVETIGARPPRS